MFGYIKGKVISAYDSKAIIVAEGVGYEVNIDISFVTIGEELELFLHTVIKESDIAIWGFKLFEDKELFSYLIQVSGVGGKTAYSIVAQKGFANVVNAIISEDASQLKVSGVGIKTAQKIILDLKSKVEKYKGKISKEIVNQSSSNLNNEVIKEVTDALMSLGYLQRDIDSAFDKLKDDYDNINEMNSQEIIKIMFKIL